MKFLGIDFGTKRVGIAVSDEDGKFAFPKEVLNNDKNLIFKIKEIIEKEKVFQIVVGESLDNANNKNELENITEDFIKVCNFEINLPIFREKEFFTSFEAHNRPGKESRNDRSSKKEKTENLDAKAAAIILQRYLDRKNK